MTLMRPRYEVADIVRAYGDEYCHAHTPSAAQMRVVKNIVNCRTTSLGGHVDSCNDGCGFVRISYNSCRDRHCPKCQAPQRAEWVTRRLERLLPVPYFHVVFTIPDSLNPIALRNKRTIYTILFKAASETLLQLGRDPKRLNADLGITAVLHTWGQNLLLHPHLHCVVTGGGLARDQKRWVKGRDKYLLPVKVLGKLFRGKFIALLQKAYEDGRLLFRSDSSAASVSSEWEKLRSSLYCKDWVVYAKPPFGGPTQVFQYLGRYTHRVAISNHRIQGIADGRVRFTVKDYRNESLQKTISIEATEFIRRFLLHVLPKGFVRIRHYGLCASQNVNTKLVQARRLLNPMSEEDTQSTARDPKMPWWKRFFAMTGIDPMVCPCCGGRLQRRPATHQELHDGNVPTRSPPRVA